MRFLVAIVCMAIALLTTVGPAQAGQTLDAVRARGSVKCGVNMGAVGFAAADSSGMVKGFDADFCRAVAAAVFGDPSKVHFVPLTADERFTALHDKQIDLLSRNSTWTMGRETELGLVFAGVTYYDGQAFLVPKSRNLQSALELDGSKVCVQSGTTTEPNFVDYFETNHMKYEIVRRETAAETLAAYRDGQCNVLTSDESGLYALRLQLPRPADHAILPDVISKEPLGPAVRQDDMTWFNIVKWVNFALVDAEDLGIGVKTVDDALKSQKPDVKRFVGAEGEFGRQLGLPPNWAVAAVKASGNYGEMFERNLGAKSQLGIPRGLNELWSNGGVQYAPPIR
jgi:general L-amino acid transport system substrate-binding protein